MSCSTGYEQHPPATAHEPIYRTDYGMRLFIQGYVADGAYRIVGQKTRGRLFPEMLYALILLISASETSKLA